MGTEARLCAGKDVSKFRGERRRQYVSEQNYIGLFSRDIRNSWRSSCRDNAKEDLRREDSCLAVVLDAESPVYSSTAQDGVASAVRNVWIC